MENCENCKKYSETLEKLEKLYLELSEKYKQQNKLIEDLQDRLNNSGGGF